MVSYLGDAINMTPAKMTSNGFSYGSWNDAFFMPRPCMLKYDGTFDYYLSRYDYSKKTDGTPSDISNSNYDGNAMMQWPKIWFKFVQGAAEGEGEFWVSDTQRDESYHCWCNINANNEEIPYFYTAIYDGTGTSRLRSLSGVLLTEENGSGNTDIQTLISRAIANNTYIPSSENYVKEWYTDVWSDRILINSLLILMGKSLDLQSTYGKGMTYGSTFGKTEKEQYETGTLNDKGLFYGDLTRNDRPIKIFGMENLWGCCSRSVAGNVIDSNNNVKIKMTRGTADGSTSDDYNLDGNGYINTSVEIPSEDNTTIFGAIKKMSFGFYGYLPIEITRYNASETDIYTKYYCDELFNCLVDDPSYYNGYLRIGSSVVSKDQAIESRSSDGNGFNMLYAPYNMGFASSTKYMFSTTLSCKPYL